MIFIAVVLAAYLLGSIPTAFILGKIFFRVDVSQSGSGNVGTLNFLRVTHSKILAVLVLLIDSGKGFLALYLTAAAAGDIYLLPAAVGVIVGHMFPVWLKGRGGRGLAPLAGIALYVLPVIVAIWWVLFGILYLLSRRYIISGMIALFAVNLLTGLLFDPEAFLILSVNSLLVMLKYIKRIRQELNKTTS